MVRITIFRRVMSKVYRAGPSVARGAKSSMGGEGTVEEIGRYPVKFSWTFLWDPWKTDRRKMRPPKTMIGKTPCG